MLNFEIASPSNKLDKKKTQSYIITKSKSAISMIMNSHHE